MVEQVKDRRLTKNEKRRLKKKQSGSDKIEDSNNKGSDKENDDEPNVEIEYVSANYEHDRTLDKDTIDQFRSVFEKFTKPEVLMKPELYHVESKENQALEPVETEDEEEPQETKKISKKKKKLLSRLSVAELKQLVQRSDVVEAHDVTSNDPRLLVYLKAYRNTVPVPRHWCSIKRYLQGKRGIEKVPFQLPDYIADTGIAKIRESVLEQEAKQKSKAKARERIRPKMGRIDIDYQVLHDAFFKYQTKPKMTIHGDLYYEGREFEVNMKEKKPGILSTDLKLALGMNDQSPPPWLINMQRYGMPPSYPNMKIPGLNAPIPQGCMYGFHPNGWGKPPVDEYGRPLYGDVFGINQQVEEYHDETELDKTSKWGILEEGGVEYFEDIDQDEEEDEDNDENNEANEGETNEEEGKYGSNKKNKKDTMDATGMETPSGMSSVATGLETPGSVIDLRKRSAGTETPDTVAGPNRELYHIIQEKSIANNSNSNNNNNQVFGSEHTYVLPGKEDNNDITNEQQQYTNSTINNNAKNNNAADTSGMDTEAKNKKRKAESAVASKKKKEFKF